MSEHRLNEILIERPRCGMRISLKKLTGYRKRLHKLTEEAIEDGLLRPYLLKPRNKSKYFSDHLGPLRRFLRSRVGQRWDDVYSDLCRRLDTRTLAGQHVLSHLWDYVECHVELIDGIPHEKPVFGKGGPLNYFYRDQFYVHPETGILCIVEKKPRKQKRQPQTDLVEIDDCHQYRKLNEIWYLITLEELPPNLTHPVRDVLYGAIAPQQVQSVGGPKMYAAKKKQCSKKEIRFILSQLAKQAKQYPKQ